MKLRIKFIENVGWFGRVKLGFFTRWKTIDKYPVGFVLYSEGHTDYPLMSKDAAVERCKLFEQWYYHTSQPAQYYDC